MNAVDQVSAAEVIPTRHPDAPLPVPFSVRLLAGALRIGPPSEAEFRRFGECLLEGDPLMDAVVDWMFEFGRKQGKAMFDLALSRGIDAVPDAPAPLRALFAEVEATPDWVDWSVIERGVLAMRSGGADAMYVARDVAMLGGYLFSGFNQTLLRTGALEKGSNQRYAETTQWALDLMEVDGLRRGGAGYRATLQVRLIHSFIRRHVGAMKDWNAAAFGLPINQTDMAATIHGSLIVPTTAVMGLGLVQSPRNLEAIAQVTRYVGWLIGVREEFLPDSFRDAVRIQVHTLSAIATPDETSRQLAMPMAEDPLLWNFARFQRVRRRIARSQHMSVLIGGLGPGVARQLGLSPYTLPWYPALRIPVNLVRSVARELPGGLERAARRGDREQRRFLARMTAGGAQIGGSVEGLRGH